MKALLMVFITISLIFSFSDTYAACADGPRSTSVGLTPTVGGCWTDGTHEYSVGSSSSSSAGYAPAASELVTGDNILGLSDADLRNGNVDMNTIPVAIVSIITFLLAIAGSLSVAALIYHAVKMQLASGITGDSSGVDKAKAGMKGAIIGFVVSILAWFIVTRFVEILASIS